jgi:hypothetical protein
MMMVPLTQIPASAASSSAEHEFVMAIQEYKKQSGRLFPTWSEILEVAQNLGYAKADRAAMGSGLARF